MVILRIGRGGPPGPPGMRAYPADVRCEKGRPRGAAPTGVMGLRLASYGDFWIHTSRYGSLSAASLEFATKSLPEEPTKRKPADFL